MDCPMGSHDVCVCVCVWIGITECVCVYARVPLAIYIEPCGPRRGVLQDRLCIGCWAVCSPFFITPVNRSSRNIKPPSDLSGLLSCGNWGTSQSTWLRRKNGRSTGRRLFHVHFGVRRRRTSRWVFSLYKNLYRFKKNSSQLISCFLFCYKKFPQKLDFMPLSFYTQCNMMTRVTKHNMRWTKCCT